MARLVFVAVFLAAVSCGGDAAEQGWTWQDLRPEPAGDRINATETDVSSDAMTLALLADDYQSSGWPNVSASLIRAAEVLWAAARADAEYVARMQARVVTRSAAQRPPRAYAAADVLADAATLAGLAADYELAGWPNVSSALVRAAGVMRSAALGAEPAPPAAPPR